MNPQLARRSVASLCLLTGFALAIWAQQWGATINIPISTWQAPAYWSAPHAQGATAFNGGGIQATGATAPLQFVAITPCRVVDTRVGFCCEALAEVFAEALPEVFAFASVGDVIVSPPPRTVSAFDVPAAC